MWTTKECAYFFFTLYENLLKKILKGNTISVQEDRIKSGENNKL